MKELTQLISFYGFSVAFLFITVYHALDGNALWAAVSSPIAVMFILGAVIMTFTYMGYLK